MMIKLIQELKDDVGRTLLCPAPSSDFSPSTETSFYILALTHSLSQLHSTLCNLTREGGQTRSVEWCEYTHIHMQVLAQHMYTAKSGQFEVDSLKWTA